MTEVEWYPLPEVEESFSKDESSPLQAIGSSPTQQTQNVINPTFKVTASKGVSRTSSHAKSTPASGANLPSNRPMTGSVQPYLRRDKRHSARAASSRNTQVRSRTSSLESSNLASIQHRAAVLLSSEKGRVKTPLSEDPPPPKAERHGSPPDHLIPRGINFSHPKETTRSLPCTISSSDHFHYQLQPSISHIPLPALSSQTHGVSCSSFPSHQPTKIHTPHHQSTGFVESMQPQTQTQGYQPHPNEQWQQQSKVDQLPEMMQTLSVETPRTESPVAPCDWDHTIALSQLDHLWKEFLGSSLATHQANPSKQADQESTPLSSKVVVSLPMHEEATTSICTTQSGAVPTPQLVNSYQPLQPIVFTIPHHMNRNTYEQPQRTARLSQLTLQEALHALRPDFVHRSKARQEALKQNRELRSTSTSARHRTPTSGRHITVAVRDSPRRPQFFYVDATNNRPRISPQQMYLSSKRHWSNLPEVKQKIQEQKRKSVMATNRLKMKLYQQEVLVRLRQKRK